MFASIFEKFAEIKTATWISLFALVALALILLLAKKKWDTRALTYGAMCIALSFILSYIRLYRMPQGGSITPGSMLPLMLYAYAFGPSAGMAAGVVYGLLQLLQDFYVMHPVSLIMDYILAFAMLGCAGFAKKHLSWGVLIAGAGRWFWQFLSGFIFFAIISMAILQRYRFVPMPAVAVIPVSSSTWSISFRANSSGVMR